MPWQTPLLKEVRTLVRDHIRGSLPGADASVPNSVLRVVSDVQAGVCHLNLQYLDWLALQLMPDTSEVEWLDRHGDIWLTNADGSTGRKMATLAEGSANLLGLNGTVVPQATRLGTNLTEFETTEEITLGPAETIAPIRALDPGIQGNLAPGTALSVVTTLPGLNTAVVIETHGGVDEENDDDLRMRVLERIRNPPMGGCQEDYVNWALRVPGVTRAWCEPLSMGMGTVTVRFMMDVLRSQNAGFPTPFDLNTVRQYIDTVRPVAVKDFFVVAPLRQRIDFVISNLTPDSTATRAAIEATARAMLYARASPGQTIYGAWKSDAVLNAADVEYFNINNADDVMESPGHMATLGDIYYVGT
jgi:uncharacterized phage protein gp47/JayE